MNLQLLLPLWFFALQLRMHKELIIYLESNSKKTSTQENLNSLHLLMFLASDSIIIIMSPALKAKSLLVAKEMTFLAIF